MPRPSRRAEVRATAARLIRQHGYAAATMDLLADEVGLNKGTLYHYYPSKSAILVELLSDQLDATLKIVSEVPETGTATERLRELVRLQVEHVSTQQDELVVFMQELPWMEQHLSADEAADLRQRIQSYERFMKQLLTLGMQTGEFRQLNPVIVMSSVVGILAYVPNWFRGSNRKSRAALVEELTTFIMRGVLA